MDDDFTLEAPKISLFDKKNAEIKEKILNFKKKEKIYKTSFSDSKIPMALTFNDVLLVPQYSEVNSRLIFFNLEANVKLILSFLITFH